MSDHHATIDWKRDTPDFTYASYTRNHTWRFEGGTVIEASAAPDFRGDIAKVDPEEAFVASLSSCHMLTFLAYAAKKGFVVDAYRDDAVGVMEKNDEGRFAVTRVTLRPAIVFAEGTAPTNAELADLHDRSHHACFIANSVRTAITVETPVSRPA